MKYTVQYTFGREWYTAKVTEDILEAKAAAKAIRSHLTLWNGKLEKGTKVRTLKEVI